MEFQTYLTNEGLFTEEECKTIDSSFDSEVFSKGETFLRANKTYNKIHFVESGLVRAFHIKDGKDITHFFLSEDHFIAPVNTWLYDKSERYELIAIEDCQVKTIPYLEFLALAEKFPKLMYVALEFAIKMCDFFSRKLDIVMFEKAYDKYNAFLKMYPNLTNRVSLGDTASYLGITQQTLSVIRAQTK